MNALVVDDEFHCRNVIEKMAKTHCPEISSISLADSVDTAINILNIKQIDIVFLDIQLHNLTGFDLLNKLRNIQFQLVFTTAYNNYAIKAFEFGALHYLLKPVQPDDLVEAVKRCTQLDLSYNREKMDKTIGFYLKTHENAYDVRYDQIRYIQADGSYSTIYNENDQNIYTSKNLAEFKKILNGDFYRIHNSIIVNLNCVSRLDRRGLNAILNDGTILPISRRRKIGFRSKLTRLKIYE